MIARGLKSNILINLVVLLSVGTFLLAVVAAFNQHRDLLQSEISRISVVLTALDEIVVPLTPSPDSVGSVNSLLEPAHVVSAAALDRLGRRLLDEGPDGGLKQELQACVRSALKTGRQEVCFSGRTWGLLWPRHHYLMVGQPLSKAKGVDGAVGVAADLGGLYQTERRSQKIFLLYGVVNIAILATIGVYRITKIYLEPLQRLARRAEDYREEDTGLIFSVRKEDNELHQLSKSLNLMLERIAADKQTLRATVASLERANSDLQKAQQEIIRAEKLASVGRLSAGIAHEIGNPIGIVMGYLDLLRQKNGAIDEAEKREYLRRTSAEIGRINTIIRQLLDLSRPSSEGASLVHVHAILADLLEVVRFEPLMADIDIRLHLDAATDGVTADPNQLRQVFLNLILNAVDALASKPSGGHGFLAIRSTVGARDEESGDSGGDGGQPLLKIAVIDNGIGIPAGNIADIFDPFYSTKEPGKGTGLGLSVSFMIVEGLGGHITAHSRPGEGTTMWVTLPLAQAPSQPGLRPA